MASKLPNVHIIMNKGCQCSTCTFACCYLMHFGMGNTCDNCPCKPITECEAYEVMDEPVMMVCANCNESVFGVNQQTGDRTCVICLGKEFKMVKLPIKVTCIHCKQKRTVKEVLTEFTKVPFFNASNGTYYCGCRGWN